MEKQKDGGKYASHKGVLYITEYNDLEREIKRNKAESCILYRENSIQYEYYRNRKTKEKQHKVNSITKSVLSALMGIAIEQGYIEHEDIPIVNYFNDLGDSKKGITIKHLLTMSSGLHYPGNEAMIPSKNWTKFVLEQPVEFEPGMQMKYSCGSSHILSAILQKTTHMNTAEFAKKHLFAPLGINDFHWYQDTQGIAVGGFGLRMKIEDMLKFGVLYAQNGEWNSKQLISPDWIARIVSPSLTSNTLYSYHWRLMKSIKQEEAENKTFYAMGMSGGRGQYIFVNQKRGLVAVFTTIISDNSLLPLQWFNNYILKE
ncbi:CubicO group peptidase (beta-lactamase class C family) [Paenibacillus sp. W4I10]|uniref:serine hydrolase domain-containing protein n=1 Tax=Paenibacillus sp. W4I10 TaxID=3042298 RepID=UPI002787540B|nr:serine hydrolase [Paenibacillus sp. W4I10]MDQ0721027.1 CubicO group peptidase (beta-lactamase class C family) [Paenibacillus sp. W4I10]